ncbi:MAG: DUF3820 family protein [Candidatus Rokubacteria bacterium]|nr:DUF3820 family protein [Candidatus Rokubacteria bacterium]
MPFGMHKGAALGEIPTEYLQWLTGRADLREPLRSAAFKELRKRYQAAEFPQRACPDSQLAEELVGAGRRVLAKRLHPDTGGTARDFVRLGEVSEWLERVIGSAS